MQRGFRAGFEGCGGHLCAGDNRDSQNISWAVGDHPVGGGGAAWALRRVLLRCEGRGTLSKGDVAAHLSATLVRTTRRISTHVVGESLKILKAVSSDFLRMLGYRGYALLPHVQHLNVCLSPFFT